MTRASAQKTRSAENLLSLLGRRPVVLVGMMGAGKTSVGRRLASQLGRAFIDSDFEIEAAAGMKIEDFFATYGEAEFRSGETKVIARLLKQPDVVLATGGGAFINPGTRALIADCAVSVWIKAEFDLLFARVSRKQNRPLLKTYNPRQTLEKLIKQRDPIYKMADLTVTSSDVHQDVVAKQIIDQLSLYLEKHQQKEPHIK